MAAAGDGDDELAALRARVVAAGGPAGVSKNFATEWLAFTDAPVQSFERDGARHDVSRETGALALALAGQPCPLPLAGAAGRGAEKPVTFTT